MQLLVAGVEKGGGALKVRGKVGWKGWMNNGNGADLELYWQSHNQDSNLSWIRIQSYVQLSPDTRLNFDEEGHKHWITAY